MCWAPCSLKAFAGSFFPCVRAALLPCVILASAYITSPVFPCHRFPHHSVRTPWFLFFMALITVWILITNSLIDCLAHQAEHLQLWLQRLSLSFMGSSSKSGAVPGIQVINEKTELKATATSVFPSSASTEVHGSVYHGIFPFRHVKCSSSPSLMYWSEKCFSKRIQGGAVRLDSWEKPTQTS